MTMATTILQPYSLFRTYIYMPISNNDGDDDSKGFNSYSYSYNDNDNNVTVTKIIEGYHNMHTTNIYIGHIGWSSIVTVCVIINQQKHRNIPKT